MKSYEFIVPVAIGMGFALFGPLLWHLRKELVLGWREQFGTGSDDDGGLVKERADGLRSMEPFSAAVVVLLTIIMIVMMFVFGVVVAYGGVALCLGGTGAIIALIALFNVVLFAQLPPLPNGGTGARK
jgi:hypothetical protein